MNITPRVLESHVNWSGADVADPQLWSMELTSEDHRELDFALRMAKSVSTDLINITRDNFPLDKLADKLTKLLIELIDGRGFVRISGLNTSKYSDDDLTMIYWGIGMHLGNALTQTNDGLIMGDVIDQSDDPNTPLARINYHGPIAFEYHSDGGDLIGLMCLRSAKSGGLSCIANAVAIHNELVHTRPDLAAALYEPLPYERVILQSNSEAEPYLMLPCFTEHFGRLFVRLFTGLIYSSQRHPETPRLSPKALEALQTVIQMAHDPQFSIQMQLQPGNIQFINNYHMLHGRTAYIDDPATGQKRHLKRLWISTPYLKTSPDYFRRNI